VVREAIVVDGATAILAAIAEAGTGVAGIAAVGTRAVGIAEAGIGAAEAIAAVGTREAGTAEAGIRGAVIADRGEVTLWAAVSLLCRSYFLS
jgi:hypothetical protein